MEQQDAFKTIESLYEGWFGVLLRYGARFDADPAVVEDSAQESMFLLYQELRRGTAVPNPKAWTMLVTKRLILRQVRRQARHVELCDDYACTHGPGDDWSGQERPDPDALRAAALQLLSPREFEVLMLRLQAMKYREIATTLKVSPNTVNRLLGRALSKIRSWRLAGDTTGTPILEDRTYGI